MGVNQTSYTTYPTQIYTFQLNVWARWCPVIRLLSYVSRFLKIWYLIKAENQDLPRTYAVSWRIFPSFQEIRPACNRPLGQMGGDCLRDNTFPTMESNYSQLIIGNF
jgi:hypothetical protein